MGAAQILAVLPQIITLISQAAQLSAAAGAVPKYLDLLALLVQEGEKAYDGLSQLRQVVADMVAQQREPTADEWAQLAARSDAAHVAIQTADTSDPIETTTKTAEEQQAELELAKVNSMDAPRTEGDIK